MRLKKETGGRQSLRDRKDTVEIKYLVVTLKEIFLILWIINYFPTILICYVQ